jgi:hypothetical protein
MTRATTPTTSRPQAPRSAPRSEPHVPALQVSAANRRHGSLPVGVLSARAFGDHSAAWRGVRSYSRLMGAQWQYDDPPRINAPCAAAKPSPAKPSQASSAQCRAIGTPRARLLHRTAPTGPVGVLARLPAASVLLLVGAPLRTQVGWSRWSRRGTLRYYTVLGYSTASTVLYGTLRYAIAMPSPATDEWPNRSGKHTAATRSSIAHRRRRRRRACLTCPSTIT